MFNYCFGKTYAPFLVNMNGPFRFKISCRTKYCPSFLYWRKHPLQFTVRTLSSLWLGVGYLPVRLRSHWLFVRAQLMFVSMVVGILIKSVFPHCPLWSYLFPYRPGLSPLASGTPQVVSALNRSGQSFPVLIRRVLFALSRTIHCGAGIFGIGNLHSRGPVRGPENFLPDC